MEPAADLPRIRFRLLLAAGLAVGLWLRLRLAGYSFWFDDYASLIFADQPQARLWSGWMARETNPPLFYAALRLWQQAGAHSDLALRGLPILAGMAHVGLVGWMCRRWHGRRAAVLAVWLLALSAQHIGVSQMLRGYGFTVLGATASLAGLMLWWDGGRARLPGMALYVLGAMVAFYSHSSLLLWQAVGPGAVALLRLRELAADRWRVLRDLVAMGLMALLGSAWWLAITLHQLGSARANISWIAPLNLPRTLDAFSHFGLPARIVDFNDFPTYVAQLLMLVAALVLGWRRRLVRVAALVIVLALVAFWLCAKVQPVMTDRTVLWLLGPVAAILACGFAEARGRVGAIVSLALVAVVAVNLAQRAHSFEIEDWRGVLDAASARPGTVLLVEHEAMAAIATRACTQRFGAGRCPIALVALHSASPNDAWARGLAPVPMLDAAAVRARLAGVERVYTLHHAAYDPLLHLDHSLQAPRTGWSTPFLEGPFAGASFAAPAPR